MAGRFAIPITSAFDSSGNPGSGWKLNFYESNSSTPLDTYSDDALSTANTNPVEADSSGRFDDIFLKDQDYKVVLTDADDVVIWTADPVRAAEPTSTTVISKTTTYVVTTGDDGKLIEADATSGAFTITLPAAATAGNGFTVYVKKVDASSNAVTLDADGSETIDGDTDVTLPNQHDVVGVRSNGTQWRIIVQPLTDESIPLPQGYISGLQLSNNSTDSDHDMDIAAGAARDDDDEANMVLSTAITKRGDAAWAVGDGNGGLDTGSLANNTVYYLWLIRRSDTGVVDALLSASPTAPTMPTSYDQRRRIGQVLTDGSANIVSGVSGTGYIGGIVQRVSKQDGAVATGTTLIPNDDTIPQNTEGIEFMTATIAPTNASNILQVDVTINMAHSVVAQIAAALFQDSTADALAVASATSEGNNSRRCLTFSHRMVAGTTSATTFKVRGGGNNAGTTTFNGGGSNRLYGGVSASSITITELTA